MSSAEQFLLRLANFEANGFARRKARREFEVNPDPKMLPVHLATTLDQILL